MKTPQEKIALANAKKAYKKLRNNVKLYNEKRAELLSWFSESKTPNWGSLEFKPCK
jgi:1,2-phenylacetyl-CoA epoxidase PaaB subunit